MKLTSKLLLAAAFAFSANMALALTTDELIATYLAQGFTHISVKSGPTQIQIEAIKDGQKVEVIYDKATGATIKSEAHGIGTVGSADPGVRLREVAQDFADGNKVGHKGKHGMDHAGAGDDDFDADLNDDGDDQGDEFGDDDGDDDQGCDVGCDDGDDDGDHGGDDGDHGGDDGDDDHGGDDDN